MKTIIWVLAALLGLMAADAAAVFHLWRFAEIYSNDDGTIQFVELGTASDGEGQLSDHTLTSTHGGVTRTFVFPRNLPLRTRGQTMLVATEGFAALGVVTPDYIVPNGFLSLAGGQLNFADVDLWQYPALPGGDQALRRNGSVALNSPQNFARQTGSVSGTAGPLNVQALWWAAPGGSESGWGLNIAHQGDILFATWFTYDSDGSGMWLVAPEARRTTGNTYTGALFRTTGPGFDSSPFDPSRIAASAVGSATFSFSGAGSGTFSYTANGVSQSKAITRQVFDAAPTCAAGGASGAAVNYQDLWWRSSESGWGVNITHQGNIVFATWFTYEASGKGMWLVMPEGRMAAPGVYSGRLYRTRGPAFDAVPFNPAGVTATDVGSGTFTFSGAASGEFAYTVNGVTQSKAIARQVYSSPATVCR